MRQPHSRSYLLAISLSLLCACNGDELSDVNGPLSMTVPATSVGPGDTIRAVITNVSRRDVTYHDGVCGAEGRPFDRRVGADWVRLPSTDTLACAAIGTAETLHPGASQHYAWSAPSDTGTYRVAFLSFTSHPFVVR
jgi:hypothetical protein